MGRAYSLNGFINAALRRGGRSLLVEGVSDKALVHRLCLEHSNPTEGSYVIDDASIISDEACAGLGNRQKVISVRQAAHELSERLPYLRDALAFLIDREWDGLPAGRNRLTSAWSDPSQEDQCFVTIGHSIENYNFRPDHVVAYLKLAHSPWLKPGALAIVEESFPAILVMASCYSYAMEEAELISRTSGLLRFEFLSVSPDGLTLGGAFGGSLEARGVDAASASALISRVNELVRDCSAPLLSSSGLRWLPHGHLGEEVVWSGTCSYLRATGVPDPVCRRIEESARAERRQFMANLLAVEPPEDVRPMQEVVSWLLRAG